MIPSRITLGTAQLGMAYGVANRTGKPPEGVAREIIETALDLGVTSFDTAPAYGESEARLGAAVRGRADVFLTTKLPAMARGGVPVGELDHSIAMSIENSLRLLGSIQTYLIHDAEDLVVFGDRLIEILVARAGEAGIERLGVSVYDPEAIGNHFKHPQLRALQTPLNLLDQRALPLLADLRTRGVLTFVRSPFLQGLFSLDPDALPPRVAHTGPWLAALVQLTERHGSTPLETALPFLASLDGIDSVVLGVDSVAQLRANVASFSKPLHRGSCLAAELQTTFGAVPHSVIDPSSWPTFPAARDSEK